MKKVISCIRPKAISPSVIIGAWRSSLIRRRQPQFPEGVELRPFVKDEHAVAVWQAQNEAFRDHWGSHDATFEEFCHSKFDDPEYDPTLWAIAWDGDQVAGFSLNRFRMGIGWVAYTGCSPPLAQKGTGSRPASVLFWRILQTRHDLLSASAWMRPTRRVRPACISGRACTLPVNLSPTKKNSARAEVWKNKFRRSP